MSKNASTATSLPKLISTKRAAAYLDLNGATLRFWRMKGIGPKFLRIGTRTIKYAIPELNAYLEQCQDQPGESQ